jgi:hypothetical protein
MWPPTLPQQNNAMPPIRHKEGRGFFITLLTVSGAIILLLGLFAFQGKAFSVFLFKKFVINKAFVSLLPKEYTLEQTEAVRGKVYQFYDTAEDRHLPDSVVFGVGQKIQEVMDDEAVSDEEVQSLLAKIAEAEAEAGGNRNRVGPSR